MKIDNDGSCLMPGQLCWLGNGLAQCLGLGPVTRFMVNGLHQCRIPMPLIIRRGDQTIWLDRYYAAVELKEKPVTYVYLTNMHILEVRRSYTEAAKERDNTSIRIPRDIVRQFKAVEHAMRLQGTKIWYTTYIEDIWRWRDDSKRLLKAYALAGRTDQEPGKTAGIQ